MHCKKTIRTTAAAALLLLAGCAGQNIEEQFGDSVRHMTEKQINNLDAAYNPDPAAVVGGDVYKMKDVLEAHQNNAEDLTEDTGALAVGGY